MALFGIKFVHSVIFIVESAAILFILYCGLFNVRSPLLALAVAAVLLEMVVFAASGFKCPLTRLAKRLGDDTGNDYVAEFFMPAWFVPYVSPVCGTLAFAGLLLIGLRLVMG